MLDIQVDERKVTVLLPKELRAEYNQRVRELPDWAKLCPTSFVTDGLDLWRTLENEVDSNVPTLNVAALRVGYQCHRVYWPTLGGEERWWYGWADPVLRALWQLYCLNGIFGREGEINGSLKQWTQREWMIDYVTQCAVDASVYTDTEKE